MFYLFLFSPNPEDFVISINGKIYVHCIFFLDHSIFVTEKNKNKVGSIKEPTAP